MATSKRYEVLPITAVYDRGTDGNSRNIIAYYKDDSKAERFIRAFGSFSTMYGSFTRIALRIGSTYFLLAQSEPIEFGDDNGSTAKKRAKALAKLTPSDKKVLGLGGR